MGVRSYYVLRDRDTGEMVVGVKAYYRLLDSVPKRYLPVPLPRGSMRRKMPVLFKYVKQVIGAPSLDLFTVRGSHFNGTGIGLYPKQKKVRADDGNNV